MGFCIRISNSTASSTLDKVETLQELDSSPSNAWYVDHSLLGQKVTRQQTERGEMTVFGDLIEAPNFSWDQATDWSQKALGNFIAIYQGEEGLRILPSMFNLIPTFFYRIEDEWWISDRMDLLLDSAKIPLNPSKEYILERLFFNYTLTNRSIIEGIRLFPINSHLVFEGQEPRFIEHTNIFDFYCDKPKSLKKSRKDLVKVFSDQVGKYLPNEKYASAFTGGFDGRCVVAAGLFNKKDFESFSFGIPSASDVELPANAARKGKFKYRCIKLDQGYLERDFKKQAEGMISDSHGMSTLSRAHYRYGSIDLAKEFSFLVSGNFGSELFRAAHLDGVMTSNIFYHWLKEGLPANLKELLKIFPKQNVVDEEEYQAAYINLISDLQKRKEEIPAIPLNAQLYFFMWEETIRNYFGPEIAMQQRFIAHRSPFLDYKFFKKLQETEFSGAYGNFRERNLAKRMKGQMFYAHFLKATNKVLFKALTGKGYRPSDLLNPLGMGRIITGKLLKKKVEGDKDPLLASAGFDRYKDFWAENLKQVIQLLGLNLKGDERSQKTVLSIAIYLNKHSNVKKN